MRSLEELDKIIAEFEDYNRRYPGAAMNNALLGLMQERRVLKKAMARPGWKPPVPPAPRPKPGAKEVEGSFTWGENDAQPA